MIRFLRGFFLIAVSLLPFVLLGQVSITPATTTSGVKICEKGNAVALTDIIINENTSDDIGGDASDHTGITLVLEAPAGFNFVNGIGSASALPAGDVLNVSIIGWTSSTVTVQLDANNSSGPDVLDQVTLSGLQLLAVSGVPQTAVNVIRNGGSATITNLPDNTVLATVSSSINTTLGVSVSAGIICAGQTVDVTIGASESGISYQVVNASDNSPLSAVSSGSGSNLVLTTSAISAPVTLKVLAIDGVSSCSIALDQQQAITIVPAPTANGGGNVELCITASSYQITSATASNGSIMWTHNGQGSLNDATVINPVYTFNPADAGNVVIFTLTVTGAGSCGTVTGNFNLTITALPQANAGSDEAICFGTTFNFTSQAVFATASSYASLSWSTNGSGTLNNASTLVPNYIPAVNESGLITFTLTARNGSCADATDQMTLTVQPQPAFTVSNTQPSLCAGGTTAITLNSGTAGSLITLVSVTPSAAGVSGYSAAGTTYTYASLPVTISNTLTNSTTSVQTVVYEFEVSVGGCVNPVRKTTTVTVRPIPNLGVVNNIASPICSGSTTDIDLSDPTSGAVISIVSVSVSPTAGGVTGYSAAGSTFANGSKVTNVLTNTTNVQQTVTYTFRSTANGCTDPADEVAMVVVEPSPGFSLTNTAASICSGGTTNIQLSSTKSGSLITLVSVTPSAAGVSGYSAAGTTYTYASLPVTISNTLTNSTTSVQTVVYEFEVSVGGCVNPVRKTTMVSVKPVPVLSAVNNATTIASGQKTNVDLSDPTQGVVITLESVSATDPSISGYSSVGSTFTNGSKLTDILVNTTSNPQTVTYNFRSSANGCADPNLVTVSVVVNPGGVFVVTNGAPQICSGSTTSLTINTPTAGASVKLVSVASSNAGVTGYTSANTVYSTFPQVINDLLLNPTTSPQTVDYEFEISVGGVPNAVHEFASVTINPVPDLTVTNNAPAICSGVQTNIDFSDPTSGALITLTSVTPGAVTGYSTAGTTFASGSKLKDVLQNSTGSPVILTYNFSVTANGCTTGGYSTTVTVSPALDFTVTNNAASLCSGNNQNIDLVTAVTGSTIKVTAVTVTPATGSVAGVLTAGTTYTSFPGTQTLGGSLVNSSNSPQTVMYEFEMSAGSCVNPVRQTVSIVVNPTPSMSISNTTSSICSGAAVNITLSSPTSGGIITLTSVVYGGVTGSLANNATFTPGSVITEPLSNATTAPVMVTYNFSITANGCTTGGYSTTVTVSPALDFTVTNNAASLCSGDNQNIDLVTAVTGSTIKVTAVTVSPAAGSVAGVLTAGTTYTSFPGTQTLGGSLVNSSNNPQTVVYEFEMSTGSCVNPVRQTVSIVVNPTPSMSISNTTSAICSGNAVNITLSSPTSGGIITLTSVVYGGVTGSLANNATFTPGSVITESLSNTTTAPVIVTYNFSITANGCTTGGYSTTVTVSPALDFTVTNNAASLCSGDNQNIDLVTAVTGATIKVTTVTVSPAAGSVAGVLTAGTTYTSFPGTQTLGGSLVNSSNNPQAVMYEFEMSTGSCVNPVRQTVSIVVNPTPSMNISNTTSAICSGAAVNITLSSSTSGGIITLTSVVYGGVTGSLANNATFTPGSVITEPLSNATTAPVMVTYNFSITANGCTTGGYSTTVVVNPNPDFTVTNNSAVICSGAQTNVSFASSTSGHQINVSSVSYGAVTGGTVTAGTTTFVNGNVLAETLTNSTNAPIDVVYTFNVTTPGTTPVCPLTATSKQIIVRVQPEPVFSFTNSAPAICSGSQANITLLTSVSGSQIRLSNVSYNGAGGTLSAGLVYSNNQKITEVLTNSTTSPITVSYTFESSLGTCTSATQVANVIVNPTPKLSSTLAPSAICSGTTFSYTATSATSGAGFAWSRATVSGISQTGTTGSGNISETLTNTTSLPLNVTYVYVTSANGCNNGTAGESVVVTVNPAPLLSSTLTPPSICSGTTFNYTATSATPGASFAWTRATLSGISPSGSTGTGNSSESLTNTTSSPIVVTYVYVISANGCTNAPGQNVTVTVEPQPVVVAPGVQSLCQGTATTAISFSGIGTSYSWVNDTPSIGLPASGTGTISSFTAVNNSANPVVATITVTPHYNNCTGAAQSFTITVNPTPKLSSTLTPSAICNSTTFSYTATSATTAAAFAWSRATLPGISEAGTTGVGDINETLTNNTSLPLNVTYVYVTSANGCNNGPGQSVIVTVNPTPRLSSTLSPASICSGTTFTYTATSSTTGATFAWSRATVAGISQSGTTGMGDISELLTNTTSSTVTVTYVYISSANSCDNSPGQNVVVQVEPFSAVNAITNQTLCNGGPATAVTFTGVATTYTWTNNNASIGLPASGTGNIASFTAVNSGSTPVTATITVTPHYNACSGSTINFTIEVIPTPAVNAIANEALCHGAATTAVNFTGVATRFDWVNDTPSIGLATSGTTASGIPSFTATNTGSAPVMATIMVTPYYTYGAVTCTGASKTYTITVNPIPDVTAASQNICSGQTSNVLLSNPNAIAGTTYSWSIGGVSGTVSGYSAGSGTVISQMLTSTAGGSVDYLITPSVNGCNGTPITRRITVFAIPVGNSVAAGTHVVCSGTTLSITPTSSVSSSTYTWTGSNGSGGTGNITDSPVNNTSTPANITYTIIPTGPGPTLCSGTAFTIVVTVNPIPKITNSPLSLTVCSKAMLSFTPTVSVAGSSYSWSSATTGTISGASANGSNVPITDQLFNVGDTPGYVTYTITATGPGGTACAGPGADYVVTVKPEPVGANDSKTVCSDVPIDYNLLLNVATLGNNVGSTYSWVAADNTNGEVTGESLTPKTGPIITDVITNLTNTNQNVVYTVTPTGSNGCVGAPFIITITIKPEPIGATSIASPICSGATFGYNLQNNINTFGNGLSSSFTWIAAANADIIGESTTIKSGTIIDDVLINTSTVNRTVVYTVTPTGQAGGCVGDPFTISVTVNPRAVFSAGPDLAVCVSDLQKTLSGTVSFAPVGVVWSGGTGMFDNTSMAAPTYSLGSGELTTTSPLAVVLTLKAIGSGACPDQLDQMTLTVNPLPTVVFFGLPANGSPPQVAENSPTFKVFGNQTGGLFTISPGIGMSGTTSNPLDEATFDPDAAVIYDGNSSTLNTITYTYTNENSCTNSSSQNIIVNAITDIDFGIQGATIDGFGNYELCAELGPVKLLGFPDASTGKPPETKFESTTPGLTISQTGSTYFIETNGLVSGTYSIKYTYKNTNDAVSIKIRTVKIFASPLATINVANSCIQSAIQFTDGSTVPATPFPTTVSNWQWNFGSPENGTSTSQNPSYLYTVPGNKTVTLKVTTTQGCSNTATKLIRVGNVPIVDYLWSAICNNDSTRFEDKTVSSFSPIQQYTWVFGDGETISGVPGAAVSSVKTGGTYSSPDHKYTTFGTYDVKLIVDTSDGCSNTAQQKVFILPYNKVIPLANAAYLEGFEATDGGWVPEAKVPSDTSWIWNTPTGATINTAASGSKAWWTGRDNNSYYDNEKSVINGPCFDLRQLHRPMVALDYWADLQNNVDGAVLQYSVDGGITWWIVGPVAGQSNRDEGINWFNSAAIVSNPGAQAIGPYGWTDKSGKWLNGRFNLDMIPVVQRDQVRLRVAFASNDSNPATETYDGFAFDNVFVGDKMKNVLVEQFTNANVSISNTADGYLDNLLSKETLNNIKTLPDFSIVQYHISSPTPDLLNKDNQADPAGRASYFGIGVSEPPITIMDGLLNSKFKGNFNEITSVEIDRRALTDPLFDLKLDTIPTGISNTIKVNLTVTARQSFADPLIAQVVLIENNIGTFNNVLRKSLFGSSGNVITNAFAKDQSVVQTNRADEINVPIVNSSQLSLVGFIQNKNTGEVYQSIRIAAPAKKGQEAVGLEEEVIPTTLNGITIFPNPADGVFNFGMPENNSTKGYSWKLADQRGVIVKSGNFENAFNGSKQISVSGLPNALYFVIITGPGHSVVYRKLVVMNSN